MKLNPRHIRQLSLWPSRIMVLFCALLLTCIQGIAQDAGNITVSGKVSLSSGGELAGTTVQVKGDKKGVGTDAEGHFKISAPKNAILVFSRIGSKSVEIKLNGQSTVNVTLDPSDNSLDQVVVVSYGKQKARNITGAIGKINGAELQDIPAAEFGQRLNGKTTGLQINQVTGRPGQAMTFRIRGAATMSGSNSPLFVVDGQVIAGDINTINPDDIESISVLKDAAAAALYGSRSSNGVILITTRQAKAGRTSMTFSTYYGWQSVPQRGRPDLMNAREFATFMKGYYEDKIKYESWKDASGQAVVPADYADPSKYGEGTDWYDALLRTAPMNNYTFNISTGTEKVATSVTATYFNQEGVMLNTGMERFSFRANTEYRPVDGLRIGFNISPTYQVDKNTTGNTDGNRQILGLGIISSPIVNPYNADGSFVAKSGSFGMYTMANPLQQLNILEQSQKTFRTLGNLYVDLEIAKGLHIKPSLSIDIAAQDVNYFRGSKYGGFGVAPPNSNITAGNSSYNYNSWLTENLITYELKKGNHNFDAMAGYTYQYYDRNYRSLSASNLPNDLIHVANVTGATLAANSNNTEWNLISYLGRLNYNYNNKYFFNFNIRRDGASRFAPLKKWGTFPSASIGWVASDEDFFPKNNVVNFLKIRASYGKQGSNSFTNDYPHLTYLSATPYVNEAGTTLPGFSITTFGNSRLSWENTNQLDIGLEANLLNNRITFAYDYFTKETYDMLTTVQIPFYSGFSTMTSNAARFRIWGHEFSLSSKNLTGELTWNTNFNLTLMDNKVLELYNNIPLGGTNKYNDYNRVAVGRRIGEFWGYVFDGLYSAADMADTKVAKAQYSAEGTTKMKNIDGNTVIDGSDRTYIGNPNVRYIVGMTNDFKYRNWDFTITASGAGGNQIMDINKQNTVNIDGIFNVEKSMANVWRSPSNPGDGKTPRTLVNSTELYRLANSNWVFDADYITIRNITLGYTLPVNRIKYLRSVRLYAAANNMWVITKYPGQNPEGNDARSNSLAFGIDNGNFPVPRSVQVGANINF